MSRLLAPLFRGVQSRQVQVLGRSLSTSSVLSSERGINKVQLLGRVGNQPKEFTSPTTGKKLVAFAVATSTTYKTKGEDGNETMATKTTWHSINIFKPSMQEIAVKYMQKGSRVYINGKLHNYKETKEGIDKYVTVVIADDIIHLQLPRSAQGSQSSQGDEMQGQGGGAGGVAHGEQVVEESSPQEFSQYEALSADKPGYQ